MLRFVAWRVGSMVPLLFGVSLVVFFMLHLLPGDPVLMILSGTDATPRQVEQLRRELGLDRPIHEQYVAWIGRAVQGDLGRSIHTRRPVGQAIVEQVGATLQLALAALAVASVLGILIGTLAALRHNTWIDAASMAFAAFGVSIPHFWLGLLLLLVFSFTLGWVPATGTEGLRRLVLPALTLGLMYTAVIARLVRSGLLEVIRQDYIRTARAKGLAEPRVIFAHALKNCLIPVVTIVGLQFGHAMANTVIIETVFSRQGIGRLAITAILEKDFPVTQGVILFMSVMYLTANMLADVAYAYLDPRSRTR
jgi:ABC-type dipeptide/oligopeptide/nickel transport system permease component